MTESKCFSTKIVVSMIVWGFGYNGIVVRVAEAVGVATEMNEMPRSISRSSIIENGNEIALWTCSCLYKGQHNALLYHLLLHLLQSAIICVYGNYTSVVYFLFIRFVGFTGVSRRKTVHHNRTHMLP